MPPSGKAFGLSDESFETIIAGIEMAYGSAFDSLRDDYEKQISTFQKREFKEHLDKCLSFHPLKFVQHVIFLNNLKMEEKIDPSKEKALGGFISAQAKKLADQIIFGDLRPERLSVLPEPDINYIKTLFETKFPFDIKTLESMDIIYDLDEMLEDVQWANKDRTSKYPEEMVDSYLKNVRMIDFDDQFKEFFNELIDNYNMSLNFYNMFHFLNPEWHYIELLKPTLKKAIMKL